MIWITGCEGMLGKEICKQLSQFNIPFVGSTKEIDITDYQALETFAEKTERSRYLSSHETENVKRFGKIQWIINCAAFTDVDKAEFEEENARLVNYNGAKNLSLIARSKGARFIQLSSNFVFDGKLNSPYFEHSPKSPCNVYGKTKAEAETIISQTMTQYYIIRTSWLYGFYKENFVSAMVNLMNQNDSLQVIGDQFSRPTSCSDLAHFIITLIEKTENAKSLIGKNSAPANGIYHYANTGGATSLYEFALAIFHYGKKHGKITNTCTIEPCPASEYKTMAQRPYNAILDTTKVEKQLKIKIPNWKTSLEQFIKNEEFKP